MEHVPTQRSQEKRIRPYIERIDIGNISIDKDGMEHMKLILQPGSYEMRIGFRPFGRFESNWFSGASDDPGARDRPFKIDLHHPDVIRFNRELFADISARPDDPQFIIQLDKKFSSLLPSAPLSKIEHYNTLSDIVRAGNGMCAAKTTLLGTLLAHRYPQMQLQEIHGQIGIIQDRVSYPFGHEWLRGESEKLIFLYDPMYSRLANFEKRGSALVPIDDGVNTFEKYSVEALPISCIRNKLNPSNLLANAKLVDEHDPESAAKRIFLLPEESFNAQVDGAIHLSFNLDQDTSLGLVDGHVQAATPGGAGIYYPIASIRKI
ncbi:hypothetical protein HYT05_04555 [Candidatus Kaiserbacteria bacterium]|nr:hypothetical protein [Candidatus Kaiserbacteria bacterium]